MCKGSEFLKEIAPLQFHLITVVSGWKANALFFFWQKFEDDISYWTNLGRARNEYYGGHYQHHYDEDSPIGPRNPHDFRHGAGVNYDDY